MDVEEWLAGELLAVSSDGLRRAEARLTSRAGQTEAERREHDQTRRDQARLRDRAATSLDAAGLSHGTSLPSLDEQLEQAGQELDRAVRTLEDAEAAEATLSLARRTLAEREARLDAAAHTRDQRRAALVERLASIALEEERWERRASEVRALTSDCRSELLAAVLDGRGDPGGPTPSEAGLDSLVDTYWERLRRSEHLAEQSPPERVESALEWWDGWSQTCREAVTATSAALRSSSEALARARAGRDALATQATTVSERLAAVTPDLDGALSGLGIDGREALRELELSEERRAELGALRRSLEERRASLDARIVERREQQEAHGRERPEALSETDSREELEAALPEAAEAVQQAEDLHAETASRLRDHLRAEQRHAEDLQEIRETEEAAGIWFTLHELIGVKEGGRFKEFAQALNLGRLLEKANVHLGRLSGRYRLVPHLDEGRPTLDFDLADLWQAGETVAPRSLSGGERFLVALSLALGLSDFRTVRMPVETLLLDEGFGTLDSRALSVALTALGQLQSDGRQVGIISHVAALRERIEARIEIRPLGGGRSRVLGPEAD